MALYVHHTHTRRGRENGKDCSRLSHFMMSQQIPTAHGCFGSVSESFLRVITSFTQSKFHLQQQLLSSKFFSTLDSVHMVCHFAGKWKGGQLNLAQSRFHKLSMRPVVRQQFCQLRPAVNILRQTKANAYHTSLLGITVRFFFAWSYSVMDSVILGVLYGHK